MRPVRLAGQKKSVQVSIPGRLHEPVQLGGVYRCGLETAKSFRNSAVYIQNWLQALKNDKRFIVKAAGKAEKAVALIVREKKEGAKAPSFPKAILAVILSSS